jgi:hypothetical protein
MNLFEFDKKNFRVHPREEVLMLLPFSVIWERDKSKNKELALKELSFIWFFCDVRSHFLSISNEKTREIDIKKDIGLPTTWVADKKIKDAIMYYNTYKTVLERLYESSLVGAESIIETCMNSKTLIAASDDKLAAAQKLNVLLKDLSTTMQKMKEAEKQYLKESDEKSGKQKGSQTFNTFEEGI